MSDLAVFADNLGKMYRIGGSQVQTNNFREALVGALSSPLRRGRDLLRGQAYGAANLTEEMWALKHISFEVKRGEVVGIIGANGAGKSTLLKVLSRITEPTEGYAYIYGRVGALLEVGTGFHQELTGRENLYLNGAILGMKRHEIESKFDEIVDFAGVERFIDTPIKHYSSGMRLRLGFSVAAHLEPDILIVDEVLAVGDAEFQKKCLGKMENVAAEGRTVLFVSHNMDAVINLCTRGYVLSQGSFVFSGSASEAVEHYLHSISASTRYDEPHILYQDTEGVADSVTCIEMLDNKRQPMSQVATWDAVTLRIHYNLLKPVQNGSVVVDIRDNTNRRLIVMDSGLRFPLNSGYNYIDCIIPQLPLASGEFYLGIGLAISRTQWIWRQEQIGSFHVIGKDVFGIGRPPETTRMMFAVAHQWEQMEGAHDKSTLDQTGEHLQK